MTWILIVVTLLTARLPLMNWVSVFFKPSLIWHRQPSKSESHGYGQSEFVPWQLGAVM